MQAVITYLNRLIIPLQLSNTDYTTVLGDGSCQALLLISQVSSIDTAAGFKFLLFTFIKFASICS